MSSKNFIIKNGLTIGSTEVIDSSGIIQGAAVNEAVDDRLNSTLTAGTGITLTYDDSANTLTIDGQQGDITGIVAGNGLTGDATSGEASLAVGAGTGMIVNADDIAIDFKDEDDMSSDSATHAASQQSIKAYVDAQILTKDNTDEITEGSTNLYYTDARADARIAAADTGDLTEGSNLYFTNARADARVNSVLADTDSLTEGSSNLYFTNERVDDRVGALIVGGANITATYDDAAGTLTLAGAATYDDSDARGAISVTDSGGDGSLAYNNSTGVLTYTGPSASEVQAHITAGTGVTVSTGEVSIGQSVATSDDVSFANLTLSGNLTVSGTTTTLSTTNTTMSDQLFELGNGRTGSAAGDSGIVIERGSDDNAFIGYDESADKFTVGTGSFTGASTGDLSITAGNFEASQITTSYANNSGGVARNIYQSTSAPGSGDGAVGDLWVLYS